MTVSLNEDFWKTNRNISDVRRSVTEGTLEGEVSSESEFLLKLKEMLSRELSLSKTEEALQFATTIFRHGKISDRKEVSIYFYNYILQIFCSFFLASIYLFFRLTTSYPSSIMHWAYRKALFVELSTWKIVLTIVNEKNSLILDFRIVNKTFIAFSHLFVYYGNLI